MYNQRFEGKSFSRRTIDYFNKIQQEGNEDKKRLRETLKKLAGSIRYEKDFGELNGKLVDWYLDMERFSDRFRYDIKQTQHRIKEEKLSTSRDI